MSIRAMGYVVLKRVLPSIVRADGRDGRLIDSGGLLLLLLLLLLGIGHGDGGVGCMV